MKSTLFVLDSKSNDKSRSELKNGIKITAENKNAANCCCDMTDSNKDDCCCKPQVFGKDLRPLVAGIPDQKFFKAIINSIKCSNIPNEFQIYTLTDYEPASLNNFICFFEATGFLANLKETPFFEPHLSLPFRPPKNIS